MHLELRHLRYVVAVADELHFTRAAERLHMSQPALSARIAAIERELGTPLFERSSRRVALTAAGEAFAAHARVALAEAHAAFDAARRAPRRDVLRIGFMGTGAGALTTPILRAFAERMPDVDAELRRYPTRDLDAGVLAGDTDAALVLLPLSHPRLEVRVLFSEPRVFLLPDDHPLAEREELTLEALREVPCIELTGADDDPRLRAWVDFWTAAVLPDGSRRPVGAVVGDIDEWLEATAAGLGVNPTSASVVRFYSRPGLRAVPGPALAPAQHAVIWARERTDPRVAALVEVARLRAADQQHPL
jgi:DNA-binding transcriptional LysR family regulator